MKLNGDLKFLAGLILGFGVGFFVRAMEESNMSTLQAFSIVSAQNGLSPYGLQVLTEQMEKYQ